MSSTQEPSDGQLATLVETALTGDSAATNELLGYLQLRIGRYCRGRIGSTRGTYAGADDVAQEALIASYRALETYQDTGERFLRFAIGIAKNKVADYFRKHTREQHTQLDEAPELAENAPDPEDAALRDELGRKVTALLTTLPEHQREIIYLRVAVGMSAQETATTLGSTPGAVRVTQHRAMTTLRKHLRGNTNGKD